MPFVKLDCAINESTIWVQPHDVLRVWIALLIKADANGNVYTTAPAFALGCMVTLERMREILELFQSSDPDSRTPDNDGRRIERIDGGFHILNYERYRARHEGRDRREYMRGYMHDYRVNKSVNNVNTVNMLATVSQLDAEAEKKKTNTAHPKTAALCVSSSLGFRTFWEAYPLKKGKGQALKAWNKLKPSDELVAMIVSAIATQTRERQSLHDAGEFVPEWKYPATWLSGECWLDETRQPAAKAERRSFEGML